MKNDSLQLSLCVPSDHRLCEWLMQTLAPTLAHIKAALDKTFMWGGRSTVLSACLDHTVDCSREEEPAFLSTTVLPYLLKIKCWCHVISVGWVPLIAQEVTNWILGAKYKVAPRQQKVIVSSRKRQIQQWQMNFIFTSTVGSRGIYILYILDSLFYILTNGFICLEALT